MTRLLILGGAGMLGHKLWQMLRDRFNASVTVRGSLSSYSSYDLFDAGRTVTGVDVADFDTVIRAFSVVQPDVVVNAIGIVKQSSAAKDPLMSISVNSLFPHQLANLCNAAGARLIHVGTDCVFAGRKGMYRESDPPDAEDLYGRTKLLGEVNTDKHLTLRTSIIGRELNSANGLVEWFMSNRGGVVKGYRKAIFSGLTTIAMATLVGEVIDKHHALSGLYHVSADPIDKNSLLALLAEELDVKVRIEPSDDVVVDRSLDSERFRRATGWRPLPWKEMIAEMAADPTPYDQWDRS